MCRKYPVTRFEYECFVEADGYNDMRWWPKDSARRIWRDGRGNDEEAILSANRWA